MKGTMSMFRVDHMFGWQARLDSGLRAAMRWWLDELASLVPEELRRRAANLRSRLLLVVDNSGAYLAAETGARRSALGRVDLHAGDPETVRRLIAAAPQGGRNIAAEVVVCLPTERALRTSVALPLAAERNLDQVLGFEFERLVPFKREDVYYAHHIVSRNKTARSLQVELTVVPRLDVQEILRQMRRLDLHVAGIEVAAARPPFTASHIPLDEHDRPTTHPRTRLATLGLGTLAVLLAIACIVIPFVRANSALDALTSQVADAKREAETSLSLQKQIDAQIQDQQFLVNRKRQTPTMTELLDIVTRLTPDDTWLTELQVAGAEIHLIGASSSATTLLGLVDQSPSFRNAAFRSSITQDSKIDRERFDIAARIAPREGP
jgi:general secretion pathway protein L